MRQEALSCPRTGGKHLFGLFFLYAITLFAINGCDTEDAATTPPSTSLSDVEFSRVEFPSFWLFETDIMRTVHVVFDRDNVFMRERLNNGLEIPHVYIDLLKEGSNTPVSIELFDDGNGLTHDGLPAFQNAQSTDLVPRDFKYTTQINSRFADDRVLYSIAVRVEMDDEATTIPVEQSVQVDNSTAPEVTAFSIPDILESGFEEDTWEATVDDAELGAGDIITSVSMVITKEDVIVRERILTKVNDRKWTFTADSSFASGIAQDEYTVTLIAKDRFEVESAPYEKHVTIENSAPVLTDAVAPETVYEPATGMNVYTFSVRVSDEQSASDIAEVRYWVLRPDNEERHNDFYAFSDNGEGGDEIAGDGIWTHQLPLMRPTPPSATIYGEPYTFNFYAVDRAGNRSEDIPMEIVIMPEEGDE